MVTINGHVDNDDRTTTPSANLRKRKRSSSPEKSLKSISNGNTTAVQRSVDNVVRELRTHDFGPALLQQPSHTKSPPTPSNKRRRVTAAGPTIEARVASESYETLEEFLEDVEYAKEAVTELSDQAEEKGTEPSADTIEKIISQYRVKPVSAEPASKRFTRLPSEALSLRGTVEGGGVKQLFSGLRRIADTLEKQEEIDAKSLPNGFEVVEAATLDPNRSTNLAVRTFGEVFQPYRNVKSLELPRTSHGSRKNVLDFVQPLEDLPAVNKQDFRYQCLHAGSWLRYSTIGQDLRKRQVTAPSSTDPGKKSQALFKAAYSSFAPCNDNTDSLITTVERSRGWWKKYGSTHPLLSTPADPIPGLDSFDISEQDLEEFIETYEPEKLEDVIQDLSVDQDVDEGEKALSEVSELLQTLSSYQLLRHAERKQNPGQPSKPSSSEFDIYEMLKEQLKILVDSLPPFAVAKLDGEQLKTLNISTKILISKPEFSGTGQADEFTLRRNRAVQAQHNNSIGRPTNTPQAVGRPYTGAGVQNNYNTQARAYNANVTPGAASYGQRPAAPMYNTPRPGPANAQVPYSQPPYRPQQPFPNATIQQYQRSLQNQYNQTTGPPYPQRTPQPNYQSQTPGQYGRSNSPQKPLVNGQTPSQPQRQYTTPQQGGYTQANHQAHATIQQYQAMERMKAAQAAQEAQRRASETPQPVQAVQEAQRHASGTPQPAPDANGTGMVQNTPITQQQAVVPEQTS